jgi:hypothetical protein
VNSWRNGAQRRAATPKAQSTGTAFRSEEKIACKQASCTIT